MEPVVDRFAQLDPVRAAWFRGNMLIQTGRAAEGGIEVFRGADLDPKAARIRAGAAFFLYDLGLREEALGLWSFADAELALPDLDDPEGLLQAARERHEASPSDPEPVLWLAFVYLSTGDTESAKEWAEHYLAGVDESLRNSHFINEVFAFDAWQRGDAQALERYLGPLEQRIQKNADAGVDQIEMRLSQAQYAYLRGDNEGATAAMATALSSELVGRRNIDFLYHVYGMYQVPELADLKADYEEFVGKERRKFLAYACGEVGFTSWKPQESTCSEVEKASPVSL
jgi:tetratricopeptide (TPR) repeat protein